MIYDTLYAVLRRSRNVFKWKPRFDKRTTMAPTIIYRPTTQGRQIGYSGSKYPEEDFDRLRLIEEVRRSMYIYYEQRTQ